MNRWLLILDVIFLSKEVLFFRYVYAFKAGFLSKIPISAGFISSFSIVTSYIMYLYGNLNGKSSLFIEKKSIHTFVSLLIYSIHYTSAYLQFNSTLSYGILSSSAPLCIDISSSLTALYTSCSKRRDSSAGMRVFSFFAPPFLLRAMK